MRESGAERRKGSGSSGVLGGEVGGLGRAHEACLELGEGEESAEGGALGGQPAPAPQPSLLLVPRRQEGG
eukprot:CAMPEP_0177719538 /NCGR_PEP_ID=MMETSP0484_2-20121128/16153_1 /TAXON_ID=354590 /ORGANISM="Rhodomonas lens, Strain RHODO" /LENGTH=69 /DNA_ID=CAMNT_0019231755 /DNA_START=68 /DNA_END=273 /DNA_ORIENTATION=-